MSGAEGIPQWYFGDSTRSVIESHLVDADDGTYTVFKPSDESGKLVIAFKAYDAVNFKEVIYQDGLYGFTEPLQFDNVEDVLDTFNNNTHSRFGNCLIHPLDITPQKRGVSRYRNSRPIELLKHLRTTAKLRAEKGEEISAKQEEIRQLNETIERLRRTSEALGGVLKTLEKQIQRHRTLEAVVFDNTTRDKDKRELSENYEKLAARMAKESHEKDRTDREKDEAEARKNEQLRLNYTCRAEVDSLETELNLTLCDIRELYPALVLFTDRLLGDDSQSSTTSVIPVNIKRKEAEKKLKRREEGSYLIFHYPDKTQPYCICVAFRERVITFPIVFIDGYYGFDETTCIFESLDDLVRCYGRIPFSVHDDEFGDLTLTYQLTT